MMIPRYLKFAIIAGVAVVLATSAMARVHFHGGTIHDPRNEIKEKILNTKLDKISEQIKTAKNNLETWTKPLDNIKAYGDDIKRVISDLNAFKKDTQGILHSEQQSIKELYNLKINDESTIGDLKREQQRLDRLHENEIIHTLERANNASEANEVLNQQAQDILKQYNDGVISEQQKNAMLQSLIVLAKNNNAMVENQSFANELANHARQHSEEVTKQVMGKQWDIAPAPKRDNTEYKRLTIPKW